MYSTSRRMWQMTDWTHDADMADVLLGLYGHEA